MTETAIVAPPGLEDSPDGPPTGIELPPGLPAPVKGAGEEASVMKPPPGLERMARKKGAPKLGPTKASSLRRAGEGASSSSSTSAASVTTEEPPDDWAPAYVAAEVARSALDISKEAEEPGEQWPSFGATIGGLPNKVLTEAMFEAVLEQASLSHLVVDFSLHPGKPCGEARVSFVSQMAAEQCAFHFQGCQWDPSGATVTVSLDINECQENCDWELDVAAAYAACEDGMGFSLPAQALTFGTTAMSSEAPVFVPSANHNDEAGASSAVRGPAKPVGRVVSSDTSTEVGESEVDEQDTLGEQRQDIQRPETKELHQQLRSVGLMSDPLRGSAAA